VLARLRSSPRCRLTVCFAEVHGRRLEPWAGDAGLAADRVVPVSDREVSPRQLAGLVRKAFEPLLEELRPDVVLLQGDDTPALAIAEVALLREVPIAHVEAGLRSNLLASPWPEEGNRREIGRMATWHFAPCETAAQNLLRENQLPSRVHRVGNPGVDGSMELRRRVLARPEKGAGEASLPAGAPYVLATLHRREGWQGGIAAACEGLRELLERQPSLHLVMPLTPNPRVVDQVHRILRGHPRVRLTDPLGAEDFARLLARAALVVTDSGSVQEEATLHGRRLLVVRDVTDRPEIVEQGYGQLVGFNRVLIASAGVDALALGPLPPVSLYGDGRAAERIADVLLLGRSELPPPPPVVPLA